MFNYNYQKIIKYRLDKEIKLFKNYIDKITIIEDNIIIVEKYNDILKLLLCELNISYIIKYSKWIYYLESIYTHYDFINKLGKKSRLANINKLINGISKNAADINIDLIEILNKEITVSCLLLEEYKKKLIINKNNILLLKTKIEKLFIKSKIIKYYF